MIFHVDLLRLVYEKILLKTDLNLRGDYIINRRVIEVSSQLALNFASDVRKGEALFK